MSSKMDDVTKVFDMTACGELFRKCHECYEKARYKKEKDSCKKIYKEYQFCLANAESERLSQAEYWESFKEKWGHYPSEIK